MCALQEPLRYINRIEMYALLFIVIIIINIIIIIITIIVIIISIIIIIIIIELTHSKPILENAVKIEPQTVALDLKILSQYPSRSK